MFLTGIDINLSAIYPAVNFPVSRSTVGLAPLAQWEHSEQWRTGVENKINFHISVKDTQVTVSSEEFKIYSGHGLHDSIVFPVSAYLVSLFEIFP